MIPGLASTTEARLLAVFAPQVTSATAETYADLPYFIFTGRDAESEALGVHLISGPDITLVVTDPKRPVGDIRIHTVGGGSLVFFDNRAWQGGMVANVRLLGSECALIFNDIGPGYVTLTELFLRSAHQFLFWGQGATAVGCSVELEGGAEGLVVGDDALISNGVWVRNHDMHALYDVRTGAHIGRPPITTVLERHVWLGQDVLLLGCERIGMGSVIGARALVREPIPPRVAAVGMPARVLRQDVSWGRNLSGMTDAERVSIGLQPLAKG
jgi:carbonic anhydrase/acetyltransferase-like protein (isoleucine patch superfamily)